MREIPWARLIRFALAGTALLVAGAFLDLEAKGGNTVGLIQPGADGPSAAVFAEDFPELTLPQGLGHDGQQFYAVARNPLDLDDVSEDLDRPRYRLQRPLFPLLAWALHPSGGGYGLVAAFAVVGIVAIFALGLAAGSLSTTLGGGAWPAALAPILPGTYSAFRLTLADTLALALALFVLTAAERKRPYRAVVAAVLAALAKESMLVLVVGHAALRRSRAAVLAAVVSVATTAAWWLALRFLVDADKRQVLEFSWPFGGVVTNLDDWVRGDDWISGVTVVGTFVLAGLALRLRGTTHPLFAALAATTAFSIMLGPDVLGPSFNGPRTLGPLLLLAILTLGTPTPLEHGSALRGGCSGRPPPCTGQR